MEIKLYLYFLNFFVLTCICRFPKFPSIDKKDTSRLGNDGHGKKTDENLCEYFVILQYTI